MLTKCLQRSILRTFSPAHTLKLNNNMSDGSSSQTDSNLKGEVIRSFLTLENLDPNIFRASNENLWHPQGSRFIFGGQVVGQALVAACNTVSHDHHAHSLHCYFLRGGNSNWPILYHVDRTRDGETYSSRSVKASQDGKAIFTMQTSFKKDEPQGYHFQMEMPQVEGPDNLMSTDELLRLRLESGSEKDWEHVLADELKIVIRPINPMVFFKERSGTPKRVMWMKTGGMISEDTKLHQCVAAYMSDFSLLGTALQPGGMNYRINFMTSLDHTIWFHNPFRVDEWMLYEAFSPHAGNGKAFCHGRVWKQDGTLAMSVAQEGVIRLEPVAAKL
ncbi:acyl-coenzyme A thioesterase 8-like isoform X2 [Dreissena polymorpha]|uniref:acyl-coenzyme A thioesterase 8-like isoform X2 n=1 Tax=Dreissena polymorpha TaxID=45954 RepID=UPI002264B48D|nr:acyl-coenzyme A thioesterase 8-like isoform X2 [Dreissena polymorpha]